MATPGGAVGHASKKRKASVDGGPSRPSKKPAVQEDAGDGVSLTCKACQTPFQWTAAEQAVHERRGYPPPARCKECRAPRMCYKCGIKGHLASECPSPVHLCFEFIKGNCTKGKACPMKHDEGAQEIKLAQIEYWKKAQEERKREKQRLKSERRISAAIAKIYNPDDYEELKLVEVPAKGEDDDDADEDDVDAAAGEEDEEGDDEAEGEDEEEEDGEGEDDGEAEAATGPPKGGKGKGKGKGKGGKGKGKGKGKGQGGK
eukprot:EG_transcript_25140